MKTFEQFLQDIHADNYTGTDDDMPDAFDDWLGGLDISQVMDYAEDYGKIVYIEGQLKGAKEIKEIYANPVL